MAWKLFSASNSTTASRNNFRVRFTRGSVSFIFAGPFPTFVANCCLPNAAPVLSVVPGIDRPYYLSRQLLINHTSVVRLMASSDTPNGDFHVNRFRTLAHPGR